MNNFLLYAIGFKEILVIGLFILLLFGGKKIPELMRGLGSGIKEFKKSVKEEDEGKDKEKTTK
ncbi:MAG: twin-arginine translocase TatA/TatE family subunit [Flavobacteriaceae bacterium]|nr:twin-arginine translocase TatA/TatE family subunit [Flavobacteriaceae bacterium]